MQNSKFKIQNGPLRREASNAKLKSFLRSVSFGFFFLIFHFALLTFNWSQANAQATYPVSELGNCRDAKECYLYCEIPQNSPACWSYGTYVLGQSVLGDTTASESEMAKKYNLQFPIAALGNCGSIAECRSYCDNSAHRDVCVHFAKQKGFYKAPPTPTPSAQDLQQKQALVEKAKFELGCTSIESCRTYCEQNQTACLEFSRKHVPQQAELTRTPEQKEELLQKARVDLGCTSMESCRIYCKQNQTACLEFSRKHNLLQSAVTESTLRTEERKREAAEVKSGCTSQESCKKYCQEHPKECPGFTTSNTTLRPTPGVYLGPGGCKTAAECKTYCQMHPDLCPGFPRISIYPTTLPKPTQIETRSIYPTVPPSIQEIKPTYIVPSTTPQPQTYTQPTTTDAQPKTSTTTDSNTIAP